MKVAIIKNDDLDYNRVAPFNPSENYPEYPFNEVGQRNDIYESIRYLFFMLGLDLNNYNKESWNPFGELIKPMDNVLIKPNLVRHFNPVGGMEQLITHGSIIRAVLDYVYIALNGKGSITIGDAPLQSCDFEKVIRIAGIDQIISFYRRESGIKINLIDFRKERANIIKYDGLKKEEQDGDPLGYTIVDLKDDSELSGIIEDYKNFRVTNYDKNEMIKHHNKKKNEYLISNSVLNADVIINLPKLKTHRKAGMTCAIKNMIGINGSKDWLPHHRVGSSEERGDEYLYKSFRKRLLVRLNEKRDITTNKFNLLLIKKLIYSINSINKIYPYKDQYFEGSWYGNDTISRTITDLNKIIFYGDKNGIMKNIIQRKMFILVDAIIAGEREGPLEPSSKYCQILTAGYNPVEVDLVCSRIMGFDYKKIPIFKCTMNAKKYRIFDNINNIDVIAANCKNLEDVYKVFNKNFLPSDGWRMHIEY